MSLPEHGLLLAGQRQPAVSGDSFDVLSPATEGPIARVARAGAADVGGRADLESIGQA